MVAVGAAEVSVFLFEVAEALERRASNATIVLAPRRHGVLSDSTGTADAANRVVADLGFAQVLNDLLLGTRPRGHLNHPLVAALLTDGPLLMSGSMSRGCAMLDTRVVPIPAPFGDHRGCRRHVIRSSLRR